MLLKVNQLFAVEIRRERTCDGLESQSVLSSGVNSLHSSMIITAAEGIICTVSVFGLTNLLHSSILPFHSSQPIELEIGVGGASPGGGHGRLHQGVSDLRLGVEDGTVAHYAPPQDQEADS